MKKLMFFLGTLVFFVSCQKSLEATFENPKPPEVISNSIDTIKNETQFLKILKEIYYNYQDSANYFMVLVDSVFLDSQRASLNNRQIFCIKNHENTDWKFWAEFSDDTPDFYHSVEYYIGGGYTYSPGVTGYTDIYLAARRTSKKYVYLHVPVQAVRWSGDKPTVPAKMRIF